MFDQIKIKTEARDNLIDEMQKIMDASTEGNETRALSDEEQSEWETKSLEVERLNKEIAMLKKQEALNATRALKSGEDMKPKSEKRELAEIKAQYSMGKAILEFSRNGQLTGAEAEMHAEADKEFRQAGQTLSGIGLPSIMLQSENRANWNTTVGSDALISVQSSRVSLLSDPSVIEKLGVRFLTGLDSAFELPKVTAATATFVNEEAAVPDGGATVSKVTLQPRRVGVKQPFTKEYLSQSNPAVTNTVIRDLSNAIMRAVNKDAIAALVAAVTGNTVTAGGDLTWKDMVDMESQVEVDNALFGNLNYLMTHGLKADLKTLYKDPGSGTSVWTDANTVNGYGAYSTNWLSSDGVGGTSGDGKHSVYFGNWDDLVVGQWGGMEIIPDNITLAAEGMIKVIASSLFDSVVVNEESFSRIIDAVPA